MRIIALLTSLLLTLSSIASATTYVVRPDGGGDFPTIQAAVDAASDGDVVLVLGKGHERSQEIGDRVLPFDDRLVGRTALADRRGRTT